MTKELDRHTKCPDCGRKMQRYNAINWYHCNYCSKTFHFPMRLKHANGTVTEF